jgi:hypothetical protein
MPRIPDYRKIHGMKLWVKRISIGLASLLLLAGGDYLAYPWLTPIGGQSHDRGKNAIWLQDTWYRGGQTESLDNLTRRLRQGGFRDAYFHVRFITKKGKLRYQFPENARRLNAQLRALTPGVRSIAWVYIGNERGITGVDLTSVSIRQKIAHQLRELVTSYGFDGIQLDYEICANGDHDFLRLLEETRKALPPGKVLGVASAMWAPVTLGGYTWSETYFREVAARCDQIAVMAYDSGMRLPRAYVWLLRQQALRLPPVLAAADPRCELLIGVPTYESPTPSHDPRAENLRLALKAVREAYTEPPANFAGIALFADYTTDQTEWQLYTNLWRTSPKPTTP